MITNGQRHELAFDFVSEHVGSSWIVYADCLEWLSRVPENSIHAIVTDPPYGVKEYDLDQLEKRAGGNGGIWRIPPSFDGHTRAPLPRFTALDANERERVRRFFIAWAKLVTHALRPGGHVFIATNAFIAQLLYDALVDGGWSFADSLSGWCERFAAETVRRTPKRSFPACRRCPRAAMNPGVFFASRFRRR